MASRGTLLVPLTIALFATAAAVAQTVSFQDRGVQVASRPLPVAIEDPAEGISPVRNSDFYDDGRPSEAKVELGRMLFFDKVLSGNKNISCGTCHHPKHATTDGVALSFGEGAEGLGRERQVGAEPVLGRVPRNSQALYFLGAKQFTHLFHDGRVARDPYGNWESGFWTPAREQLPPGLDSVLAAQAMFPVLSDIEMAGHKGENPIANAAALDELEGPDGAWALLAKRLQAIPEYVALFQAAYPEVAKAEDMTFVQAANAIAAFEAFSFRADNSAFDRYLRSRSPAVLSQAANRGMALFYGKANCVGCHTGALQTDQQFHAIAMPQVGPGKNDGFDRSYWRATGFMGRLEDTGRYRVTTRPEDRYRFRTPSLRNVELTGPWGHAGTYQTLEGVIRHHVDPVAALEGYDVAFAGLPKLPDVVERTGVGSRLIYRPINPAKLADYLRRDGWVQSSTELRGAIAKANELAPVELNDQEVGDLVAFLKALTDPTSRDQSSLIPDRVPSGLPVAD